MNSCSKWSKIDMEGEWHQPRLNHIEGSGASNSAFLTKASYRKILIYIHSVRLYLQRGKPRSRQRACLLAKGGVWSKRLLEKNGFKMLQFKAPFNSTFSYKKTVKNSQIFWLNPCQDAPKSRLRGGMGTSVGRLWKVLGTFSAVLGSKKLLGWLVSSSRTAFG